VKDEDIRSIAQKVREAIQGGAEPGECAGAMLGIAVSTLQEAGYNRSEVDVLVTAAWDGGNEPEPPGMPN
jgi:hypothetical protein